MNLNDKKVYCSGAISSIKLVNTLISITKAAAAVYWASS